MQYSSVNWSIALFLLLYVFMPTAFGGFYLVLFSVVLFAVAYLLLYSINRMQLSGILMVPDGLFFLMAIITLTVTMTLTLNAVFFSTIGLSEIAKPFIFMTIFVFGVCASLNYSLPVLKKTLVLISKIIIIGQLVVVIDQVFSINAFSVLYDYGKTSSTEDAFSFMRSTGTLYNPNYFGWIILHSAVVIFLFTRNISRPFWLILAFLMILLSGSKSMITGFFVALFIAGWLKGDRVFISRKNIITLLSLGAVIFVMYKLLLQYPDVFPRFMILIQLLSGEDESGGGRFEIWEQAYTYFLSKEPGLITWLLGMGPIEEFKTVDNGYLYMLFRNGIVGLILHIILIIYFIQMFYRFEDNELGALGFEYVFIGILTGLIGEAFAGWSYSIQLFLFAGIVFSYKYRNELVVRETNDRSIQLS